jgi:hypothetical protein
MSREAPKILQLNLHREYFDRIAQGRSAEEPKTHEFRDRSPHWDSRLGGRTYDFIRFRNGYGPDVPEMDVEFKGVKKTRTQYIISLGKILRIKNWPPK